MDLFFADPNGPRTIPPVDDPTRLLAVCPDDLSTERCRILGMRTLTVNDDIFLTDDADLKAVIDLSCRLARSWRLDRDGSDFTLHNGISLGALVEGIAWNITFGGIFRFMSASSRVVAEHRPQTVWASRDLPPYRKAVIEAVCGKAGIPPRWLGEAGAGTKDYRLARDFCKWPLRDHARKRRVLNAALRLTGAPSGRRVLASYYYTIHPLISRLGQEPGIQPIFYDWPGRVLPRLPQWRRWRFLTTPARPGLSSAGAKRVAEIARRFSELCGSAAYRETFTFSGLPCWEAVRLRLERIVRDDFPMMAEQVERLGAAIDREPPALVVVPYDCSPSERLLIETARLRKIPSALVLHGLACYDRVPGPDTNADYLLVGGPALIDLYREVGFPQERIRVTGLPLLDMYARRKRRARKPDQPVRVLFLSTILPIKRNVTPVLDALTRFKDVDITIKLHPGEPADPYRLALSGRRCHIETRRPLSDLLLETDLVFSGPSTALIEAMALDLPIVLLNLEQRKLPPPFDGGWGLEPCSTMEELQKTLGGLLPDRVPRQSDYSRILEGFAGKVDGRCSERAVQALHGIIGG